MSSKNTQTPYEAVTPDGTARPVTRDVHFEIEQFLFREATLLDRRLLAEWLELLSPDVRYRVAARTIREAGASSLDYFIIDEIFDALKRRVDQLRNPKLTHAENPPAFTRRFVSNVQAQEATEKHTYKVTSNFLVYRHRLETPEGRFYAGERQDILRRIDGTFQIADRFARLDQAAFAGSISIIL